MFSEKWWRVQYLLSTLDLTLRLKQRPTYKCDYLTILNLNLLFRVAMLRKKSELHLLYQNMINMGLVSYNLDFSLHMQIYVIIIVKNLNQTKGWFILMHQTHSYASAEPFTWPHSPCPGWYRFLAIVIMKICICKKKSPNCKMHFSQAHLYSLYYPLPWLTSLHTSQKI